VLTPEKDLFVKPTARSNAGCFIFEERKKFTQGRKWGL